MSVSRSTRRLAFQALFQIDVHNGQQVAVALIRSGLASEHPSLSQAELDEAMQLAASAWAARAAADSVTAELAPTWPAHRQAAVDRAILRLAHYDMTVGPGAAKPKVVINDAVEIAKEFSTDKSPGFVNALLDKVLKRLQATPPPTSDSPTVDAPESGSEPTPPDSTTT